MQRPLWAAGVTVPSHDLPTPLAKVSSSMPFGEETCTNRPRTNMGPESSTLKFCDKTTPWIGIRSSGGGGRVWRERDGEGGRNPIGVLPTWQQFATLDPQVARRRSPGRGTGPAWLWLLGIRPRALRRSCACKGRRARP